MELVPDQEPVILYSLKLKRTTQTKQNLQNHPQRDTLSKRCKQKKPTEGLFTWLPQPTKSAHEDLGQKARLDGLRH